MSRGDVHQGARPSTGLLDARQLQFRIGSRTLWSELSITLQPGERLAVSGPSGTGKTLLLRTLAGLESLANGNIMFENRPLQEWSMPQYRARVVYVAQTSALREGTVREAIEAPFRLRVRRGERPPMEIVREHLAALGHSDELLSQPCEHLSGGEREIVAMLRVLAVAPRILLLDEPTASLDPATAANVESLVARWLAEDPQRATIWTSHDAAQLERVCDRVLLLRKTA